MATTRARARREQAGSRPLASVADPPDVERRPPFGTNPLVGERGTDTRLRILTAALDVFADVGFSDARVELITARAGCSRPAFYQYFSSKDDVFWALAADLGREMVGLAERLGRVTPDADGLERLTGWITEFMDLHEAHAPVFASFQAASRAHPRHGRQASGISDRIGDALLDAFGVSHTDRHRTLMIGLVAMLIRCSFYAESMPRALDREPLIDGLARVVHRLLAGPTPGVNMTERVPPERVLRAVPAPIVPTGSGLTPRGQQTRQRLLDAGASVLPSRGYHDTRVDDIVATTGVSHGTFYRYFANKDEFFRALAEPAAARLIELLDELRLDSDIDGLRDWLRGWFITYQSNGGVISTWQEMQTNEDLAAFSRQVAADVLTRLVRVLKDSGLEDPSVDAVMFLALVERLPYTVYTLGFIDQADAIEAMIRIIRRGFLGLPDEA